MGVDSRSGPLLNRAVLPNHTSWLAHVAVAIRPDAAAAALDAALDPKTEGYDHRCDVYAHAPQNGLRVVTLFLAISLH